jgi:hypothetical protein
MIRNEGRTRGADPFSNSHSVAERQFPSTQNRLRAVPQAAVYTIQDRLLDGCRELQRDDAVPVAESYSCAQAPIAALQRCPKRSASTQVVVLQELAKQFRLSSSPESGNWYILCLKRPVGEPRGSPTTKLARGASDGRKLGGYLALTASFATVERGTSEAPIFALSASALGPDAM